MTAGDLPAGYVRLRADGVRAFAWAPAMPWLERALAESATLDAWASRRAVGSHTGRGPVRVVDAPLPGPDRAVQWAVRHYRRGGVAARLLGDRYLGAGRPRPDRELEASEAARARGIRTPAVVAGAVYARRRSGTLGVYRADLVTELVPGARGLAEALAEDGSAAEALRQAGRFVAALGEAGLRHPDLNAGNVQLDEHGEVWVLDLDRARCLERPSPRGARGMLTRLERSLAKLERAGRLRLPSRAREELRAGFEERGRR